MNVQQLFENQFEHMRKQDQAKYFLMQVVKVAPVKGDPDSFIALGVRIDNEQNVAVYSKKSTSGQHFPEPGGILRADKVSRMPQKSKNDITAYSAEYFHAYRNDDFCIRAVAQAQRPKKDPQSKMWSADMRFFDVEKGPVMLDGNQIAEQIERELARMLKPWKSDEQSSITHDVKGSPLWGDGQEARPGMSPFVAVRSGAKIFYVYGDGAVRQKTNNENEYVYSLPTDEQVKAKISKNTGLQNLLAVISNVKGQATPEQMAQLKITLIPGLQVRVGRDSLGGEKQSYLAVPSAFDWKNKDVLDDAGNPTGRPGFRPADAHIKMSSRGSMMVVDAAPSAGGRLTQFIPETSVERELRVVAEQASAPQKPDEAQPQSRGAVTQEKAQVRQVQEAQPSQYDAPAPNKFDDEPMDDFGDVLQYADDLLAMQSPDQNFGIDEELDSLMEEANQRQMNRTARPRM
jgi:hypothetical protein